MKAIKIILGFLLVFTLVFTVGKGTVLATGYTIDQLQTPANGWYPSANGAIYIPPAGCPPAGCTTSPAGTYSNQTLSGYYYSPNTGLYYPIGAPASVGSGGGSGPAGVNVCTGVYDNCSAWNACSTTCGPGTQARACYDTGCGTMLEQTQACQVNDPNVWLPPTTLCSVKCGTGTWNLVNQCGTTQAFACNTQACADWIKLKNSSFISPNSLSNMINLAPTAYDADDTSEQYFIVGTGGVVVAPAISLDISNISPTAKTGNPEYKAIYTPTYSMTPALFLSYVKARKEFKVITNLSEITGSGVYVYNGNITISSNVIPFNQAYKIVLIASGAVTVSPAQDNTFSPTGTAAIVAPTISFDSAITEAQGIFIGNSVTTGTNATQGLKIVGNLIAQTSLSNNREWPTTSKPSLFIKFDQAKYISLLPYLSTASYQWRQIQ